MSWYVTRNAGGGSEEARYVVRRLPEREEAEDALKSFRAQRLPPHGPWGPGWEGDLQVRGRAQAFCDQLNTGGIAREQGLRSARR